MVRFCRGPGGRWVAVGDSRVTISGEWVTKQTANGATVLDLASFRRRKARRRGWSRWMRRAWKAGPLPCWEV